MAFARGVRLAYATRVRNDGDEKNRRAGIHGYRGWQRVRRDADPFGRLFGRGVLRYAVRGLRPRVRLGRKSGAGVRAARARPQEPLVRYEGREVVGCRPDAGADVSEAFGRFEADDRRRVRRRSAFRRRVERGVFRPRAERERRTGRAEAERRFVGRSEGSLRRGFFDAVVRGIQRVGRCAER